MRVAQDPPESPAEETTPVETTPSLVHRVSTGTCSHDPPEIHGKRGTDPPSEHQVEDSLPVVKSSVTARKSRSFINNEKSSTSIVSRRWKSMVDCQSSASNNSGHDGAMVLYDHGPPSPPNSPRREKDENAGALVTLEPRGMEVRTSGREIVTKPPPMDYASEEMRRGLDHCYVTVPCKERLSVLFATLRRSSERKVIVICSTWESAAFHALLFRQLEMLHIYEMHENMNDKDVAFAYDEFLYLYPGILFSSEIAMREFDVPPNVDYLVQYEPPSDPTEYIYQMSNANVYRTSCHKALLFLTPDEMLFLEYFDNVDHKELEGRKVSEFQESVEKLVAKHSQLNNHAWRAYRAFMIAYESHSFNNVYDHTKIDESKRRRSFGRPHFPEESLKYLICNNGATGEKKEDPRASEILEATREKRENKDSPSPHRKPCQWTDTTKTWRKEGKPWATRETKTWKHSHRLAAQKSKWTGK